MTTKHTLGPDTVTAQFTSRNTLTNLFSTERFRRHRPVARVACDRTRVAPNNNVYL